MAVVMDWREMCSRPTVHGLHGQNHRGWDALTGAYSGGKKIGVGSPFGKVATDMWEGRVDPRRGWCIAFSWVIASLVEYVHIGSHTSSLVQLTFFFSFFPLK